LRCGTTAWLAPAMRWVRRAVTWSDAWSPSCAGPIRWSPATTTSRSVPTTNRPGWARGSVAALEASRRDDLRRGVTTVGPHRDELDLTLAGLPARTHASQGEQRSLAFALRMAAHALVADAVGTPPVLVLDDVFSELDPQRSRALLDAIPAAQTILTTAAVLPEGVTPDIVLMVDTGTVTER
jgi:DNA replication and repair protein RecF